MSEGKVWLVGAGPGDPGLITLAGLQALKEADVVVYDRLIPQQLLAQARPDSELIYVGKIGHSPATAQEQINALLVEKARQGKKVVRLKGGDPFLFGRGGEEAQALAEAGIPFVVVPGVTSAIAVPAYAGIPVTHRGLSSSLAVVTGHEAPGKAESMVRWGLLAQAVDTLVVLMGAKALPSVVEELIAAGRSPETPAAVIYMGTTAAQRTVTAPLSDIARRVEEAGLGPPTVLVVGEVVRLRDSLAWYDKLPLFGRRVVVTRPRHQAERLSSLLAREGAEPIELPLLEVEGVPNPPGLEEALARLKGCAYRWVVFTSANAVDHLFHLLEERGLDARALAGAQVAAIGTGTARALARRGIHADLVPPVFTSKALGEALSSLLSSGERVLWPRGEEANEDLPRALTAAGAHVDHLVVYRTRLASHLPREILEVVRHGAVDAVAFTSSATVRYLLSLLDGDTAPFKDVVVACIGPVTAQAASAALGRPPDVVAEEHTMEGLVEALKAFWAQKGGDGP